MTSTNRSRLALLFTAAILVACARTDPDPSIDPEGYGVPTQNLGLLGLVRLTTSARRTTQAAKVAQRGPPAPVKAQGPPKTVN